MSAVRVLLLHGVNVWNTGDCGLLQTSVARLRDELGSDVDVRVEDVFTHRGDAAGAALEALGARSVPPLVPLRRRRGWGRGRWMLHIVAVTLVVIGTRLFGRRFLRLIPGPLASPILELLQADVVISKAGGHTYQTPDQLLPSPSYLFSIWAATFLRRPVVIYAQSVGPFPRRLADRVARIALRGVRLATAREPRTYEWLGRALGPRTKVYLTADEAFQMEVGTVAGRSNELGMTAIAWRYPGHPDSAAAARAYEDAMVEVARWYIDHRGGSVSLVRWLPGGHVEDDAELVDRLVERVERPGRVGAIGPFAPREAAERLGAMEMLVASRLHSAIFAMVAGTPAIAIEYLPKTSAIMEMAVGSGWTLPIEAVDQGRLLARVQALHARLPEVAARLEERIPQLRARAAMNARHVRAVLELAA